MTVDAVSAGLAILLASQLLLAVAVVRRFGRLAANTIIPRSKEPVPLALSVIIPVLNEESRILPCLEAVLVEADGTREIVEILVVDGGSTDAHGRIVQGPRHTGHEPIGSSMPRRCPQSAAGRHGASSWGSPALVETLNTAMRTQSPAGPRANPSRTLRPCET